MTLKNADRFLATARERERIRLHRLAGESAPWTVDPIFRDWYFCNVHREHDKTTRWFRQEVRDHLDGLAVVEATVNFRFFNLISTGERILDLLLGGWNSAAARERLADVHPLVTGAYQIKTHNGMSKLEGQLLAIDTAKPMLARMVPRWGRTLRAAHTDLKTIPCLGPFLAYEIVSDLRWTPVLANATDILSWACAGPGASAGLGLVARGERDVYSRTSDRDQMAMRDLMQELLAMSRDEEYWPQAWRVWEMREVEHWACEFAKYETGREYTRGEDGKFHLVLDGDPPKLAEFRDNNVKLMRERDLLKGQAEADKATLAELAATKPDVSKLEADLAAERRAHAATQLKHVVTTEFLRTGGRSSAIDFMAAEAAKTFAVEDGKVTTKEFSTTNPSEPLTVEEWMAKQLMTSDFAFQPSRGGGARGSAPAARFGAPITKTLRNPTAQELGQHAADIAAGKIKVEHTS
jgi:hypothetical protein